LLPKWYEAQVPIYCVERVFDPPISVAAFTAGGAKLAPCIQERDVKHIASHLATDGSRCVCLFEAADAERIREANRTAGIPFERVWATNVFRADGTSA
jgi:hypothetical protein